LCPCRLWVQRVLQASDNPPCPQYISMESGVETKRERRSSRRSTTIIRYSTRPIRSYTCKMRNYSGVCVRHRRTDRQTQIHGQRPFYRCCGVCMAMTHWPFLPAPRYASAGTSYGPVSVCLSVCHMSEFYRNEWTNRAVFWHGCFLRPILCTLSYKKIRVSPKIAVLP